MDRNGDIDLVGLLAKRVSWRIDRTVEKSFRDIQTMHQLCALLNIGGDEGKMSLQL